MCGGVGRGVGCALDAGQPARDTTGGTMQPLQAEPELSCLPLLPCSTSFPAGAPAPPGGRARARPRRRAGPRAHLPGGRRGCRAPRVGERLGGAAPGRPRTTLAFHPPSGLPHCLHPPSSPPPRCLHPTPSQVDFPERPGALRKFLGPISPRWNVTLFHYRRTGGWVGAAGWRVRSRGLGGCARAAATLPPGLQLSSRSATLACALQATRRRACCWGCRCRRRTSRSLGPRVR